VGDTRTCDWPKPSCWGAIDGPAALTLLHRRSGWLGRPDHRAPRQKMCLRAKSGVSGASLGPRGRQEMGAHHLYFGGLRVVDQLVPRQHAGRGVQPIGHVAVPDGPRHPRQGTCVVRRGCSGGLCDSWAPLGAGVPVFLHNHGFFYSSVSPTNRLVPRLGHSGNWDRRQCCAHQGLRTSSLRQADRGAAQIGDRNERAGCR
jgi:hypothetical protein